MTHPSIHQTQRLAIRSVPSHSLRCLRFLLFNLHFTNAFGTEGNEVNEGRQSMKVTFFPLVMLLAISCSEALAGPRVDIVIGEKAPALEKLAADELASQLKRLYEADVKIGSTAPANAEHVFFVGSPDTNASMKPFADSWPSGDKKLTDQGHLLRSVTHRDRPALLIGGGSPVATFWAVAEFGHRMGIRSMLFGDLDPVTQPRFEINGLDVVKEPMHRVRGWQFSNSPSNAGAWGLDEYRQVLVQLAKLKFNRVRLDVDALEPFAHFEHAGIKRQTGHLWHGERFLVTGDTSGRKVFGGAKFFENPDFAGATTYEDQLAAGKRLLTGVIEAAHDLGLTVHLRLPMQSFPQEFAALFPDERWHPPSGLLFIDLDGMSRDPAKVALQKAYLRAFLETYPHLDGVELQAGLPHPLALGTLKLDTLQRIFSAADFPTWFGGRELDVRYGVLENQGLIARPFVTAGAKIPNNTGTVSLAAGQTSLPMLYLTEMREGMSGIRQIGADGFVTESVGLGDYDFNAYWLSRASFDESLALDRACRDLLEPVCGEEVHQRVFKAFEFVEQAKRISLEKGPALAVLNLHLKQPRQNLYLKSPPGTETTLPPQWAKMRDKYLDAMNEMYRANTRARDGGRAFTLYWARRCEFAFEYMNCIEANFKAQVAEGNKETSTQIAELEKAIESLNNALNAMAAVARSNSDRGLIAVLNEHGYRPLKKKLAEAEDASK